MRPPWVIAARAGEFGGSTPVVRLERLAGIMWSAVFDGDPGGDGNPGTEWAHGDWPKVSPGPAQAVAEACGTALDPDVLAKVEEFIDCRTWDSDRDSFVPPSTAMRDNWTNFCRTVAERDLDLPHGDTSPGSDRDKLISFMGRITGMVQEAGLITECLPGERIWRGRMRADRTPPHYTAADIGSAPPAAPPRTG